MAKLCRTSRLPPTTEDNVKYMLATGTIILILFAAIDTNDTPFSADWNKYRKKPPANARGCACPFSSGTKVTMPLPMLVWRVEAAVEVDPASEVVGVHLAGDPGPDELYRPQFVGPRKCNRFHLGPFARA